MGVGWGVVGFCHVVIQHDWAKVTETKRKGAKLHPPLLTRRNLEHDSDDDGDVGSCQVIYD